jgi:hypothetical protein
VADSPLPEIRALSAVQLRSLADQLHVPPELTDELINYALDRAAPGPFIRAMLEGDLRGVSQGPVQHLRRMPEILRFCEMVLRPRAWGDPASVARWLVLAPVARHG